MAKLLTNVLLSLLALYLSYSAFQLTIGSQLLVQSGLPRKLSAPCSADLVPHPEYTNIPKLDGLFCRFDTLTRLVTFFHVLINTAYYPFFATLFSTVTIVALFPFLEAAREHRPFVLTFPTPIGILYQLYTMAVVMPIYALLFVVTGTAPARSPPTSLRINQGNAEALLFGIVVGYVLPTILMLYLADPIMTAVWQGFPLLIALASFAHKLIRPPSRHTQSGHPTVLATLALIFVFSALLHIIYVWPILLDVAALRKFFVPVALSGVVDPETLSLTDGVMELIKWDLIFGAVAVVLATLWMADSVRSLVGILVWHGVATIVIGPGAAIAGVFLWRERRLNGRGHVEKIPEKTE